MTSKDNCMEKLVSLLYDISSKISDQEYLEIMEAVKKLHEKQNNSNDLRVKITDFHSLLLFNPPSLNNHGETLGHILTD